MAAAAARGAKLRFAVLHCSSEESGFPAAALSKHTPQSQGWVSERFAAFPQTIIIMFDGLVQIDQLQLLSNASKIASKVEVHLSKDANVAQAPKLGRFEKLGHTSFSDNRKSGLKARELKSVSLNREAIFVKLVLHQPHVNDYNLFNQVGLVALNAIGSVRRPLGLLAEGEVAVDVNASVDLTQLRPRHAIEPGADMAIDVECDSVTAQQIRELFHAKDTAVLNEDYVEAKRLKAVIEFLREVGKKLYVLEKEKRDAVLKEDYDTAKDRKDAIDAIRDDIKRRVQGDDSFGRGGAGGREAAAAAAAPFRSAAPAHLSAAARGPVAAAVLHDSPLRSRSPVGAAAFGGADESSNSGGDRFGGAPAGNPDERPLPALVNNGKPPTPPDAEQARRQDLPDAEELSANDLKHARPFIDAFGEPFAQSMFSRTWSLREHAVKELSGKLDEHGDEAGFRVVCQFVERMLKDKIAQVVFEAFSLLESAVGKYARTLKPATMHQYLEPVCSECVARTGDVNNRIRDHALSALMVFAGNSAVGVPFVCSNVLRPVKNKQAFKLISGRLLLLRQLVGKFGFAAGGGGLSLDAVLGFCVAALGSSNGQVRSDAVETIVECYKQAGRKIMGPLKPLKKQQLDMIEEGIAKLEGRPAPAASAAAAGGQASPRASGAPKGSPRTGGKKGGKKQDGAAKGGDASFGAAASSDAANELMHEEDPTVCQFCGVVNAAFAQGDALDEHLIKDCPMLMSCPACTQVVEIHQLNEHLLNECEMKDQYKACPRCHEAVKQKVYQSHVQKKACKAFQEGQNRCLLCHTDIGTQPEDWLSHFTNPDVGCKKNVRTQRLATG